ncbi:MAG: hypothetical protein J6P05_01645 [Lachnospiraceae bacterium]|nr:hypothetical protein [Lachnospiraceae bacterium]
MKKMMIGWAAAFLSLCLGLILDPLMVHAEDLFIDEDGLEEEPSEENEDVQTQDESELSDESMESNLNVENAELQDQGVVEEEEVLQDENLPQEESSIQNSEGNLEENYILDSENPMPMSNSQDSDNLQNEQAIGSAELPAEELIVQNSAENVSLSVKTSEMEPTIQVEALPEPVESLTEAIETDEIQSTDDGSHSEYTKEEEAQILSYISKGKENRRANNNESVRHKDSNKTEVVEKVSESVPSTVEIVKIVEEKAEKPIESEASHEIKNPVEIKSESRELTDLRNEALSERYDDRDLENSVAADLESVQEMILKNRSLYSKDVYYWDRDGADEDAMEENSTVYLGAEPKGEIITEPELFQDEWEADEPSQKEAGWSAIGVVFAVVALILGVAACAYFYLKKISFKGLKRIIDKEEIEEKIGWRAQLFA